MRALTRTETGLRQRLIDAARFEPEFKRYWVRHVTGVDWQRKTGFAFAGDFLEDGDVELDATRDNVFIVAASTERDGYFPTRKQARFKGEYRYIYEAYKVMLLQCDGEIVDAGIRTSGERWAVSIRDQVELLLKRAEQERGSQLEIALRHLTQKAIAVGRGDAKAWEQRDVDAILILIDEATRKPAD